MSEEAKKYADGILREDYHFPHPYVKKLIAEAYDKGYKDAMKKTR